MLWGLVILGGGSEKNVLNVHGDGRFSIAGSCGLLSWCAADLIDHLLRSKMRGAICHPRGPQGPSI